MKAKRDTELETIVTSEFLAMCQRINKRISRTTRKRAKRQEMDDDDEPRVTPCRNCGSRSTDCGCD